MSRSVQLPNQPQLGCNACKRCTNCLYRAISSNTFEGRMESLEAAESALNLSETGFKDSRDTVGGAASPKHEGLYTAAKLGDTKKDGALPENICCCKHKAQPRPQIFECYACTRVIHHHSRIPSTFNMTDKTLGSTVATNTTTSSSPSFQDAPHGVQEYQDISPLKRFLLEDHDQQSSIIASDVEIGALSISPEI